MFALPFTCCFKSLNSSSLRRWRMNPRGQGSETFTLRPHGPRRQRMIEATGVEAKTIHRLLGSIPRAAGSNETRTIPSIAISWLSTRPRWSTSC
jgi:hypothetical protein